MLLELVFVSFFSFSVLFLMRKVAKKIGLVDKPNSRKLHSGAVPLVGGVSIYLSVAQFISSKPDVIPHSSLFLGCVTMLIWVGVIDDKFDVSFKIRLIVQGILSLLMIHFADLQLESLGNIIGLGDIHLGVFAPLVTVLAVIGAINAFNMVDGIDGLLGGLTIVTLSGLTVLLNIDQQEGLACLCLAFIAAIVPYILMNLGMFGRKRKVFMGDAGSTMVGFTVIWLLLSASQNSTSGVFMRPVTALWLIAIPLMDMTAIMFRRVCKGDSPFKPDREHLHHIFQRLGCSSWQTLVIICSIATICASFGVYGELSGVSEFVMCLLFVLSFIIYIILISYALPIADWLRCLCGLTEKR